MNENFFEQSPELITARTFNEADSTLSKGKSDNFIKAWQGLAAKAQEEFADKGFWKIKDEKFGEQLNDTLQNRFFDKKVVDDEKNNIALFLGRLGVNNEVLEEKTTNFLLEEFDKNSSSKIEEGIIRGLSTKLLRANLPRATKEEPTQDQQDRIKKIIPRFLVILKNPQKKESLKKICIKHIFDYAEQPELASTITETLRNVLKNPEYSLELRSMSANELSNLVKIGLVERGDEKVVANYQEQFAAKDKMLTDRQAQLVFLNGLLRIGNQSCLVLIQHFVDSDDEFVAYRAQEAKNVIEKFEEGRNEKI